jgi:hypothetical protein
VWRCGDGLFFEVPTLASDALLTTLYPLLEKRAADRWSLRNFLSRSSLLMVGKAQKSHGARYGLYGGCSNGVPPIHFFQTEHRIQFTSRPMRFLGFSNHEKGALRQEISNWLTVCSTFPRSGWSVVRSALLAGGGTSKTRPWTLQTALVFYITTTRTSYCLCRGGGQLYEAIQNEYVGCWIVLYRWCNRSWVKTVA